MRVDAQRDLAPSARSNTARLLALALGVALLGAGCGGGGGGSGSGVGGDGLAPSIAGPGQVLVAAEIVDPSGEAIPGLVCRLAPLALSPLHAETLGFQTRTAVTDAFGRVGFLLPLDEATGTYGGRFYRLEVTHGEMGLLVRADVLVDAAGAQVGQVRLWSAGLQAARAAHVDAQGEPTGGTEVRLQWNDTNVAGLGAASGYRPTLFGANGAVAQDALITGFANSFTFGPLADGAAAPAYARVAANVTRRLASGTAYLALWSEAVALGAVGAP